MSVDGLRPPPHNSEAPRNTGKLISRAVAEGKAINSLRHFHRCRLVSYIILMYFHQAGQYSLTMSQSCNFFCFLSSWHLFTTNVYCYIISWWNCTTSMWDYLSYSLLLHMYNIIIMLISHFLSIYYFYIVKYFYHYDPINIYLLYSVFH